MAGEDWPVLGVEARRLINAVDVASWRAGNGAGRDLADVSPLYRERHRAYRELVGFVAALEAECERLRLRDVEQTDRLDLYEAFVSGVRGALAGPDNGLRHDLRATLADLDADVFFG